MRRYSVAVATALIMFLGIQAARQFYASSMSPSTRFVSPGGQNLERAVVDAQMNLGMLMGRRELDCRHIATLSEVVKTMNASQGLVPDQQERVQTSNRSLHEGMLHVIGKPTGPWQVALAVVPRRHAIRIAGYGADLKEPLLSREVTCR